MFACRLVFKIFTRLTLGLLLSAWLGLSAYANELPGSGTMLLAADGEQGTKQAALLMDSQATISISGMVARVEFKQSFSNTTGAWVEGRYLFPLPENAAVDSMDLTIGERLIKGMIKEKNEAQKIYREAKAAGKVAAVLEQQRPNLFSQRIANIAPGETITVKLSYFQAVSYRDEAFSLRFPMTITPRYIPGKAIYQDDDISVDESGWGMAAPTQQVDDAHLITPPVSSAIENPISLQINLDAGLPLASIESSSHPLAIRKENEQHHIEIAAGQVSMDRDFVLSWKTTEAATPRAAIFNETIDGENYNLIMLTPPSQSATLDHAIPKETIFIIDTSGSMGGTSLQQAKLGLVKALEQLEPQDRFNIIEFNSDHWPLFDNPVLASSSNIQAAINFTRQLTATGGTEMLPALTTAFQQSTAETHLKQIIFITDGSIGNEDELLKNIHKNLNTSRLFTVAIGSAPNSFFMRKAAELGRGSFTTINNVNHIDEKMTSLFKKIKQPMMRDISILEAGELDIFPYPIADLYHGEPLLITLKNTSNANRLTISGTFQSQAWQQELPLQTQKQHKGISKLWARHKVEALVDKKRLAPSAAEQASLKQAITQTALQHQIVSPYTSFVAVEEIISRPEQEPLSKQAVANQSPHGQQLTPVNYPQTASTLWLNLLLGLLSFMGAGYYRFHKQ